MAKVGDIEAAMKLAVAERGPALERMAAERNCGHEYPFLHRLFDVVTEAECFRISRCVTCAEEVFVERVDRAIANEDSGGVPIALRGERLWRWAIHVEKMGDQKRKTDWSEWLVIELGDGKEDGARVELVIAGERAYSPRGARGLRWNGMTTTVGTKLKANAHKFTQMLNSYSNARFKIERGHL